MADVDLDVHGVRYAEIYTDLKRDMKLRGVGFVALLDFTTVDTLKGTLERVILEKTGLVPQVDMVCYYKKRRRGAVFINTQRDVMLACCEYPLVTRTGKPAPDTYIRVGVMLTGCPGRHPVLNAASLGMAALTVRDSLALHRHVGPGRPRTRRLSPPSLAADPNQSLPVILPFKPLRKIAPKSASVGRPLGTLTSEIALEPPAKRVRLSQPLPEWEEEDEAHGHSSHLSSPHSMYAMLSEHHPTTVHIKPEPQDSDDETCVPDGHSNNSTGFHDDLHNNHQGEESSAEVGSHKDASMCCDPSLKMMWDQLKGLESRLNNMEGNIDTPATASTSGESSGAGTRTAPNDTKDSPKSSSPLNLSAQIVALEKRVIAMETTQSQVSPAVEQKLAGMEQKLSRTLSTIDKLGKSIAMVGRKQAKSNNAVSTMTKSFQSLSQKFTETQVTMDKMYMLLLNKSK